MNALERLKKAQERVMVRFPHWSSRIVAFPLVETEDISGLSFDRWGRIYFNPKYVNSQPLRSLAGTLFLLLYIELNDLRVQAKGKDPFVWMIACMLEAAGNFADNNQVGLPQNAVYPGFYNFPNRLSAVQYYRRLLRLGEIPLPFTLNDSEGNEISTDMPFIYTPGENPLSFGSGFSDGFGFEFPWESDEPWVKPELDPILESILQDRMAKERKRAGRGNPGAGSSDSLLQTMLSDVRIPWHTQLEELLGRLQSQNGGSLEYSFGIPSGLEDVLDEDMLLPGCRIRGMELALIVDTSASMNDKYELSANSRISLAFNEARGILAALNPVNGLIVISNDTRVKNVQRVYSPHEIKFVGGGGTSLMPAIIRAKKLRPKPDAVIVITDGECSWAEKKPSGPEVVVLNINWQWSQTEDRNYWPCPKWAHLIEMFPPDTKPW